jgi:predicted ATPase/GAF domain-containing protein
VLVAGPPGVGKSAVIRELHRELGGGACVAGKFEQMRRDQPYSAVLAALAQLVDATLAASDEDLARVRWELERTVGKRGGPLALLLPGAAALLGPRALAEPAGITGITAAAARGRTHRALLGLVRAYCGLHRPLVIELDDLQWADAASLELLAALLTDGEVQGLLVVASYRDGEVGPDHPLRRTLATIAAAGCPRSELVIGPLDLPAVTDLCAATLARPATDPDLQALAAVVHDRCGGVALLCGEFLRDLHRHDLVRFSIDRRGFTWDLAAVLASATSADVVQRLADRTRALDDDARSVLQLAACLGGSFTADDLAARGDHPPPAIDAALRHAAAAGFLVVVDGRHRFFHDRVQQAVLATLDPPDRARHHLAIARDLRGRAAAFAVADHYNLALDLLADPDERRALASLNLAAARDARAAGAFAAIVAYAGAGLAALPPGDHALGHALGLLRAEALFVTGDFTAAAAAFTDLLASARDDRERSVVVDLQVNLEVHLGNLHAAQAIGLAGLRSLGLELKARPAIPTLIAEFMRTRAAIGKRRPEDLLDLPALQDDDVRHRLKLLYSISSAAFQVDFRLMVQIALRTTRMSLVHGNSPLAAAEYISYGLMIGSITGDRTSMDAYGRVALALLERHPDRGVESLVRFLYGALIQAYCHPLRDTFANLREAHQCGVDTGNFLYAAIAQSALAQAMWTAGCPIDQVQDELARALAFARRARVDMILRTTQPIRELVAFFLGEPAPAPMLVEPTTDEREVHAWRHADWQATRERALHAEPLDPAAVALSERADRDATRVLIGVQMVQHLAHHALVLARDHAHRGRLARLKAARAIDECARKLAVHAAECPANYAAWHRLVLAEQARIRGDEGAAIRGYEQAADLAREHGLVGHEALACITAARFYAAAGLRELARVYLVRARRAYIRLGAVGRVAALDQAHPGLDRAGLGSGDTPNASIHGGASITPGGTLVQLPLALDFASLFKATQAFAEEVELDRLLDKVMAIVVENMGAERGVLLLERDQGLVGARAREISQPRGVDLGGVPLAACPGVPPALVHYVQRTGKAVAIPDLALDPRFADDPGVRAARTRSALCAPLVHQGRRLGVLYLDNNLSAGVFDEQQLAAIHVLAIQAAIAIERALFYTRLDAARHAAEAANTAKTRFLANMSHELRTPLNAILGYGELLAEEAEARGLDDMRADLGHIRQAGQHLLGIISDILDLTKIEADRLDLGSEPIVSPRSSNPSSRATPPPPAAATAPASASRSAAACASAWAARSPSTATSAAAPPSPSSCPCAPRRPPDARFALAPRRPAPYPRAPDVAATCSRSSAT